MPPDHSSDKPELSTPSKGNTKSDSTLLAMAMELPFTLVGAVVVGGSLGYFLDRWLHTAPWLLVLFGAFGFAAGVREVVRRLPTPGDGK